MKIKIVRFIGGTMLGKQLDVNTSVTQGQMILGQSVKLSYFNDYFLCIYFTKEQYSQLIPWAQVATVMLEGEVARD